MAKKRYTLKLTKGDRSTTKKVTAESLAEAEEKLGIADDVEVELVNSEPVGESKETTKDDEGSEDSDSEVEIISVEEVSEDDSGESSGETEGEESGTKKAEDSEDSEDEKVDDSDQTEPKQGHWWYG